MFRKGNVEWSSAQLRFADKRKQKNTQLVRKWRCAISLINVVTCVGQGMANKSQHGSQVSCHFIHQRGDCVERITSLTERDSFSSTDTRLAKDQTTKTCSVTCWQHPEVFQCGPPLQIDTRISGAPSAQRDGGSRRRKLVLFLTVSDRSYMDIRQDKKHIRLLVLPSG